MRSLYRLLSWLAAFRAASRGPTALGRNRVRRSAHKTLARLIRKLGL